MTGLRFASLGSGSRGNATLVEAGRTLVMIDCGFSVAETEKRMARLGRAPSDLTGILITHEHGDHIVGLARVARRFGIPVWLSAGTRRGLHDAGLPIATEIVPGETFAIEDLEIQSVKVVHDSREPTQFVLSDGNARVGVLTDVGCVTPEVEAAYSGLDALFLECNHDFTMLQEGPYTNKLKKRVGGRYGHLNNGQAADLLRAVDTTRLQHVVAAHISEKNNTPALARAALAEALGCDMDWIGAAHQTQGLDWRAVA